MSTRAAAGFDVFIPSFGVRPIRFLAVPVQTGWPACCGQAPKVTLGPLPRALFYANTAGGRARVDHWPTAMGFATQFVAIQGSAHC
jgi:hypothetical protein